MSKLCNKLSHIGLCVAITSASWAIEDPESNATSNKLEEMVVTGSLKNSALMGTPMTLSAIRGEDLSDNGINSLGELKYMAPGITFVDAGESNTRIVIRGIQGTGEATAGLYYDDVSVSGVIGATNDAGGTSPALRLIDVDRVEILRGPQGTLYGAGAMSGAVKVFFNKPTYRQETTASITLSDTQAGGQNYDLSIMNNTPLFNNKLLTRLVIYGEDHSGYIDNTYYDREDINDAETKGARLSLSSDLNDDVSITASWLYQKQEGERPMWYLEEGEYHSINRVQVDNMDRLEIGTLTIEYLLDDAQISSIISHMSRDAKQVSLDTGQFYESFLNNVPVCNQFTGLDCTIPPVMDIFNGIVSPYLLAALYPHQSNQQNAIELRYATDRADQLNLTTGVYYSDRNSKLDNYELGANGEGGAFTTPRDIRYHRQVWESFEQKAAFAELSFPFTNQLTVTAGTRYFEYEKSSAGQSLIDHDVLSPVIPYQEFSSEESGWISRFLIDFQVSDDWLTYFSVSEGYRPGGVNQAIDLPDNLQGYDADTLTNFEIGTKAKLLNDKLFASASLYRAEWDDIQITGRRGLFRFTANANQAQVDGLELETRFKANDSFTISSQLNWMNAELTEDQNNDNLEALNIDVRDVDGLDGDPIPYTPEFTASLQLEYRFWQDGSNEFTGHLGYNYVGSSQSTFRKDNPYYREIDAYELIHLNISGKFQDSLTTTLFVDNLTNETAITYAEVGETTLGQAWVTSVTPRTIGLSISKTFH
ncbi:MAG: TonB-dependent receptor [Pseudomonadales bacterium]|nr:TonB-dependent receptor [Pseudomonadales bacterium]